MEVNQQWLPFLVDKGATCSTMNTADEHVLTAANSTVMGFSGELQTLPLTKPLETRVGRQVVRHSYIYSPASPVNLLGRDVLVKLGATILCGPQGLIVTLPDGTTLTCSSFISAGQYLVRPLEERWAEIYWAKLNPESPDAQGIVSLFLDWKPWIVQLGPSIPPSDPPHVTLFYDRDTTEWYQDKFRKQLEGQVWQIHCNYLYIGNEGVAAAVYFTSEQEAWYRMSDEAVPHVSLSLHPEHEAKELGGMVKRASAETDWEPSAV